MSIYQHIRWKIANRLELCWWKLYLKNKVSEDYLKWKSDYWKQLLNKIPEVQFNPDQSYLDAGCGPAGIFIIHPSKNMIAIDPLIHAYRQTFPHFRFHDFDLVRFENQTIESISFYEKFDIVFCLNAINHVQNIDTVAEKLIQATKRNGYLVIGVDTHRFGLLKKMFSILPADILHPHQGDLTDYKRLFLTKGVTMKNEFSENNGVIFNYSVLVFYKNTA